MPTLAVNAKSRSTEVHIGAGSLAAAGPIIASALKTPHQAVILADALVPQEHLDTLRASLEAAGIRTSASKFTTSEYTKTLTGLAPMLDALARTKLERTEPVIALGGGVLGDMAGFAAASYRRGVPWVNCPTTLLSMVDASVGGKTGLNLALTEAPSNHLHASPYPADLKKNMIGAFWQPALVFADPNVLASLSTRHMRSGLAECVKHGMLAAAPAINDPSLGSWIAAHAAALADRDMGVLVELITRNIAVKARLVELDEREENPAQSGGRALLNLGHTFAHALETLPGLSVPGQPTHAADINAGCALHHGEAVALGLVAASHAAFALGLISQAQLAATVSLLSRLGLPVRVAGLPASDAILAAMFHDKKVAGGKLRLILPVAPGLCKVVIDPPAAAVKDAIDALRPDSSAL